MEPDAQVEPGVQVARIEDRPLDMPQTQVAAEDRLARFADNTVFDDVELVGLLAGASGTETLLSCSEGEDYLPLVREYLILKYGFTREDIAWAVQTHQVRNGPCKVFQEFEKRLAELARHQH